MIEKFTPGNVLITSIFVFLTYTIFFEPRRYRLYSRFSDPQNTYAREIELVI